MKISQSLGAIAMGRSAATLSRDITDEIGFHIEMLREELIAGGMKPEDAKLEAQRRFGDSRKIAQECESIQIGKWIWFTRISLASIGVLLMIVGGLVFLVFKLTLNNKILHERLATESALSHSTNLPVTLPTRLETLESGPLSTEELAAGATVPELAAETLRGIVLKADGKPIENAKVVLVHKSWPNGKFQMDNDSTTTDEKGIFRFEDLYSIAGANEFLVTVFAPGYEMKSEYVSIKAKKKASAVEFKLREAKKLRFQFVDENQKPLPDTHVVVLDRKVGSKQYMTYPISADDCKQATDGKGEVDLPYFLEGDAVKLGVLVFDEITSVETRIDSKNSYTITVKKK